jgi:hypothetical protein
VMFNEITKKAVQEALKHPKDLDQNLFEAQQRAASSIAWSATRSVRCSGTRSAADYRPAVCSPLRCAWCANASARSRRSRRSSTGR